METTALLQALAERIRFCVEKIGGKRAFSEKCKFSESQTYRLLGGTAQPIAEDLLIIAQTANVNPAWLLTGSALMEPQGGNPRPTFRPELLTHLTQLLDETLLDQPYKLSPLQRAKVLTFLYEAACHEEAQSGLPPRPAFTSKAEVLGALDYLMAAAPLEDGIDLHMQAMRLLEGWEEAPKTLEVPMMLRRWAELVSLGQQHYMDHSQGEAIYDMFGYEIDDPKAADRLTRMMNRFLNGKQKDFSILDIGSGNGRELAFLFQRFPFIKPKGIEISELGAKRAHTLEAKGKLPKGTTVLSNAIELPFPSHSFDLVYTRLAFGFIPFLGSTYISGAMQCFKEMARVLKPGGHIEMAAPLGTGRDYLPLRQRYSRADIEDMVRQIPELEIVEWKEFPLVPSIVYRFEEKFVRRFVATIAKK